MRAPSLASLIAAIAVAVSQLATAPGYAGPGREEDPGEVVRSFLRKVEEAQQSVESLKADFVEVRKSRVFKGEVKSTGKVFYLAPASIRWEYHHPAQKVTLLLGNKLFWWRQTEAPVVRERPLGARQRRYLRLLFRGNLTSLMGRFTMTLKSEDMGKRTLILVPSEAAARNKVSRITIAVDSETYLPVMVSYEKPSGEKTSVELLNVETGVPLEPSLFQPPKKN